MMRGPGAGDIAVDVERAREVSLRWRALAPPATRVSLAGVRRPHWTPDA